MKKVLIATGVILILSIAWYFVSPLFISNEINEAFPTDGLPTEEEIMKKMEDMSDEEVMEYKKELMEQAEQMPDTIMNDPQLFPDVTSPAPGGNLPAFPLELATGSFVGADNFHRGSGTITIYELASGKRFLRFENFSVTNGPDLRVFLTAHAKPTSEADVKSGTYIEIAPLKGNKGNQNYELPDDIDIDDFKSVLIYCKPFHVVFATAAFN